jgi:hypothetical protein
VEGNCEEQERGKNFEVAHNKIVEELTTECYG